MKRTYTLGMTAVAVGLLLAVHALAEPVAEGVDSAGTPAEETPAATAPPAADWTQNLCATVEEGAQLLRENHLAPANGELKQALLEAMIRASEPSVVFMDEAGLAVRTRQQAEREWEVGLTLVASEGLPKVAAVRAASPAEMAGIQSGEWIEKVGGHSLQSGTGLKQLRDLLTEGEDPAMEIGVRGTNEESRVVTLERVRRTESSLTDIENLPAGMGYMRAAGIYPGSGSEIVLALDGWQQDGLFGGILDLRGSGGLAAEEIPVVTARFVPEGAVQYWICNRDGEELESVASASAPDTHMPLMVLTDEETTGASELLAAVLVGSVKGAMVIGRETSGDPLIREPRPLSTGQYALLATRQIKTADGATYSGRNGVIPDVVITDSALDETVYEPDQPILRKGKKLSDEEKEDRALRDRTRNDTYLRRATDVLLGLKALGYDSVP
jgi:C-terminal processing protease CtpA/Prc